MSRGTQCGGVVRYATKWTGGSAASDSNTLERQHILSFRGMHFCVAVCFEQPSRVQSPWYRSWMDPLVLGAFSAMSLSGIDIPVASYIPRSRTLFGAPHRSPANDIDRVGCFCGNGFVCRQSRQGGLYEILSTSRRSGRFVTHSCRGYGFT
ncbi:hypothetical protein HGRIS_000366 [Hohenbuehelia grisea]|uniref:Uncharacterized protein n=1 Tax=Hohenbuehelia grisea TaxID=104357 RepID=A0ABR3JQU1_9AGAR